MEQTQEVTVYAPVADSTDNARAHRILREALVRIGGGLTKCAAHGMWEGPAGREVEQVHVYTVLCESTEDNGVALAEALAGFKINAAQAEVIASIRPVGVIRI